MRTRIAPWGCSLLVLVCCLTGVSPAATTIYSPHGVTTIPHTYFGIHGWGFESGHTPWPLALIGAYRTWDSGAVWSSMELSRGNYDWSKLDSIVEYMQGKGVDLLFTFGRTPQWASSSPAQNCAGGPGQCAPPSDFNDWATFVQAIASRYKGRIKYYELWNEPDAERFWTGTTVQLVQMAKLAYPIIKQADPAAQVLTPAPQGVNGYLWMEGYFAAGGQQYADTVAFHGYPGYDGQNRANAPETWIKILLNMNSALAYYNVHKPLWDTEFSWEFNDRLADPTQQAAFVARMYVLHWLYGVDRAYWDMWDGSTGTLWMGQETPAGTAYEVMTRWLAGASLDTCKHDDQGTWTCHLARANGLQSWILWNVNGPAEVQPDGDWALHTEYDLAGRNHEISASAPVEISTLPVMVEGAPASTGPDFYLAVSPNSALITGNGSAEFKVTLTPTAGFHQSVNLSCTGGPTTQSCAVSPPTVAMNGTSPMTVIYTVTSSSAFAKAMAPLSAPFAASVLGLLLVPGSFPRQRFILRFGLGVMLVALLLLGACGGNPTRAQKSSGDIPTVGSYTLTLAAGAGKISHGTYVTLDVQ